MTTTYSRKGGLCRHETAGESDAAHHDDVSAFVVRRMADGSLDLVVVRLPEEEVEQKMILDLGALPSPHGTTRVA